MEPKEGSQEYYLLNRARVDLKDISTWKYLPFGDPMRKIYDYQFCALEDFLQRYYKEFLSEDFWQKWIDNIVLPAFNKDIEKFKVAIGKGVPGWFDYAGMKEFYEAQKKSKHTMMTFYFLYPTCMAKVFLES